MNALDEIRPLDIEPGNQTDVPHVDDSSARFPYDVLQAPIPGDAFPEVRRAPAVHDALEILPRDRAVVQELLEVLMRELPVVAFNQRDTLFACDLAVADFVRGVGSGPANAEFDVTEVIVITVNAIIEAGVFRIGTLGTLRIGRETGVLGAVVEVLLRVPELLLAAEMTRRTVVNDLLVRRRN